MVQKYFCEDSLRKMVERLKNLRRNKNKRPVLNVKISLMKSRLIGLRADISNMYKNEVINKGFVQRYYLLLEKKQKKDKKDKD